MIDLSTATIQQLFFEQMKPASLRNNHHRGALCLRY